MSYLNLPRISFAGLFEADVNTVNNDVRNYSVEVFEERFQKPQVNLPGGKTEYNGWWNPAGSNRFSIVDCAATGAIGANGAPQSFAGLTLQAQYDRTAAKLVDLDPQFQMASGIWGLRVGLAIGDTVMLAGTFFPASFRDLFFGRLIDAASGQPVAGSASASARFTGYLDALTWDDSVAGSPVLAALRASAGKNKGRLSLSLVTYGYSKSGSAQRLTGSVLGSLGTWLNGEPNSFAPGRRFAISATSPNGPFASAANIGYMNALVTDGGQRLSVDFGNSLPLLLKQGANAPGSIETLNLGPITVAVCTATDTVTAGPGGDSLTPCVTEGQLLTTSQYEVISVLAKYDMAWMKETGGVVDFPVPAAARALIADHPLLLLLPGATAGQQVVALRETYGGIWARADNFVQRLDTAPTGWVESPVSIWAMRWGLPWAAAPLSLSVLPKATGQGGTGDPDEVRPPQTAIPDNNVPAGKISLPPQAATAPDGTVTVSYWASNPGNPRVYIDGQIYQLGYSPAVSGQSPTPPFEVIIVHVRDAYVPPPVPSWETDVRPILVQYGNLYPIMSRGLFSLSDADTVASNARLLHLAFTLPVTDPNYMPATRDMSAGKLRMIVNWLQSYMPVGSAMDYGAIAPLPVGKSLPVAVAAPAAAPGPHPSRIAAATARRAVAALGAGNDGKTAAVREFLRDTIRTDEGK